MPLKRYWLMISTMLILSFTFGSIYDIIQEDNQIVGKFFHTLTDIENAELDPNYIVGYFLDLNEIDPELCYLALGAVRNFSLIQNFSRELGYHLKNLGIDFVVFGNLMVLEEDTDEPLKYIGNSPYLISEILYRMIRGLETSGVTPVIIITSKDDRNATQSLLQKSGSFYTYSDQIKNVDIFFDGNNLYLQKNNLFSLPWNYGKDTLEETIQEIFNNSIVLTGWRDEGENLLYRKINTTDLKSVTYFSKSVEESARKVFSGELLPTGNKNW
ncbi:MULTISPECIES: hypothetical protein [unclassified Petrotoga]|uniref:hypothetical protein n=1 Tax=unclassified Petrotoga TaxID=2620614 RepID=UPI0011C34C05|nr:MULTISPECIES: hypothetical protein [unclassified Petrotoga]